MDDQNKQEIQNSWANGQHVSSKGDVLPLGEMPTKYLRNVIGKYSNLEFDVSALEKELLTREDGQVIDSNENE